VSVRKPQWRSVTKSIPKRHHHGNLPGATVNSRPYPNQLAPRQRQKRGRHPCRQLPLFGCIAGSGGTYFSFGYRILTVRDPPLASASAVFSVIPADLIGLLNQFTVEPDEREQCENE
jgi:hypothetical protein